MTRRNASRACALWATALGLTVFTTTASADVALCAAEQAISCTPYEVCERSLPGAVNLPSLIKIDTEASEIVSVQSDGQERSSPVASFSETEASQLIHGADGDRPWVVQIDKATGRFTGTVAGDSVAFILFGECSWELMK